MILVLLDNLLKILILAIRKLLVLGVCNNSNVILCIWEYPCHIPTYRVTESTNSMMLYTTCHAYIRDVINRGRCVCPIDCACYSSFSH